MCSRRARQTQRKHLSHLQVREHALSSQTPHISHTQTQQHTTHAHAGQNTHTRTSQTHKHFEKAINSRYRKHESLRDAVNIKEHRSPSLLSLFLSKALSSPSPFQTGFNNVQVSCFFNFKDSTKRLKSKRGRERDIQTTH